MKKIIIISISLFSLSSCYNRIGDLTLIANRNVDSSQKYTLLARNVTGKAKTKKKDALERAVDKATESVNGEYLMNVKVFVSWNGKKVKVEGDVWGYPAQVPAVPTEKQ